MLYKGKMTGRKVKDVPRGRRSGHVRYQPVGAEQPLLESGWVRNPDISTGVPLLELKSTNVNRNGPDTWPKIGTPLVIKLGRTDMPEHRRWCRAEAHADAYRRILSLYAPGRSHRVHMVLFRKMMEWVELGRPAGWTFNIWVNRVRINGGNMVLADRLLLYVQLDLDDDEFLEACNKAPVLLVRAPS